MIWNPWKEIKRLREEIELRIRQAHEWAELSDELFERLDAKDRILLAIISEEKPTSNSTVKRIIRMAREAMNE